MSEYRHYQGRKAGAVISTRASSPYSYPAEFTEVKVAPLDAIVIKRDELPEVRTEWPTVRAGEWSFDHHADDVPTVESAKAYLAAALWFEKNPPKPKVDEAQVKAVARALESAPFKETKGLGLHVVRALVERGVRVEASDG